jgi:hypothetical protein
MKNRKPETENGKPETDLGPFLHFRFPASNLFSVKLRLARVGEWNSATPNAQGRQTSSTTLGRLAALALHRQRVL